MTSDKKVPVTEAEWLACERPEPMLEFLRERASDRQLRLFACACCRSVYGFIPEGPCRQAIEVSLRFAEGLATVDELAAAHKAAIASADRGPNVEAAWAACETANPAAMRAARVAAQESREQIFRQSPRAAEDEARTQAVFLRDIVGNPFRPVPASEVEWLAGWPALKEIVADIQAVDLHEDLQLLGEKLDELGCDNESILNHCRTELPHVRGCWVVELLREACNRPTPLALLREACNRPAPLDLVGPPLSKRDLESQSVNSMTPGTSSDDPKPRDFPYFTVGATLLALFGFLALCVLVYRSPNFLGEPKVEPPADPAARLNEVRSKNEAALEGRPGSGAKMSVSDATTQLLGKLKSEKDTLPFPIPEPPAPPPAKK